MADAKNNLEEAEHFESACHEYAQRIESAVIFLKNAVTRVGETWRDADYEKVVELVEAIERESSKALVVAQEEIIPYVSKKVEVMKSK
jgi:hypothetical protein